MNPINPQQDKHLVTNNFNSLDKKQHIERLIEGLTGESELSEFLVPVQTWTTFWITHSLALLEQNQLIDKYAVNVIEFMTECAHPDGGYGGGPGQIAHLATTFAAINALITTSKDAALHSIDRVALVRFLHRMKQSDGSFSTHEDGEIDARASYCALSIMKCLNIQDDILLENVADWLLSCQTYEGGFGSVPGSEAHGGYTFCCVASLCLLDRFHQADIRSLLRWLTNKQLLIEGGFCGRSNKLVDSCYSYWQGAVFPLIYPYLRNSFSTVSQSNNSPKTSQERSSDKRETAQPERMSTRSRAQKPGNQSELNRDVPSTSRSLFDNWLFDCASLQDYVLNRCQSGDGLFVDKPGVSPDYYHTCYALSGLSISQHQPNGSLFDIGLQFSNQLAPTHPVFNLTLTSLQFCLDYFRNKKIQIFQDESGDSG